MERLRAGVVTRAGADTAAGQLTRAWRGYGPVWLPGRAQTKLPDNGPGHGEATGRCGYPSRIRLIPIIIIPLTRP